MMGKGVTEPIIEQAALAWFKNTGWPVTRGPDMSVAQRTDCDEVLQERWLWVR